MIFLAIAGLVGFYATGFITTDALVIYTVSIGAAEAVLILLWQGNTGILKAGHKLMLRLLKPGRRDFIVVDHPLALAALKALLNEVLSFVATLALPLPGIPDVNLTPRLLPVPRSNMGAAV